MKKFAIVLLSFLLPMLALAQNVADSVYLFPSENATFVGGDSAAMLFVKNNLNSSKLPAENLKNTIYVKFIVEKSGAVSSPKILKGISQLFDDEVLRMVMSMPAWTPAKHEGQIVRSEVVFPISIKSNVSEVVVDTTFLSKNWKRTAIDSAAYYRIRKMIGPKFKIQYYLINGILIEQGEYSSLSPERKNGSFIAYYDNGVKSSEYVMVNDTIQGEAIDYYPNGSMRLKQNYLNGFKHGDFYEYLENGQLQYIRTFKNGLQIMVLDGKEKDKLGSNSDEIFTVVEEVPSFPGGEDARIMFLAKHLKYPQFARENNIEGTVYISFVVEIDGSMSHLNIKRDIGGGCGEAAFNVIRMMPKWNPGKQRGKLVRTAFTIPITFRLR